MHNKWKINSSVRYVVCVNIVNVRLVFFMDRILYNWLYWYSESNAILR